MDGLAVGQQHHTQPTVLCIWDAGPAPNPAVSLNLLDFWKADHLNDPLQLDAHAIGPKTRRLKVGGGLHCASRLGRRMTPCAS